jgi:small subunit ribosomal protein S17e
MGNIRQTYIKSTADALLRQYPNEFTTDFNENKAKVERLARIQTRKSATTSPATSRPG